MIIEDLYKEEYWLMAIERLSKKQTCTDSFKSFMYDIVITKKYIDIADSIKNETYVWSIPRKIQIKKPGSTKKRTVYSYDDMDRVLLGVLYCILSENNKDMLSDACFSYRKGVRTLDAIQYLLSKDKLLHNKWGLKLDIHAYFNSLKIEEINKLVDDSTSNLEDTPIRKLLKQLFGDNRCYKGYNDNEIIDEFKSLIPGTPIAAYYANMCLKELDDKITQEFNIAYARYSDDIIFFTDTKDEAEYVLKIILDFLAVRGLTINEKKYVWYEPQEEVTYLGLKFYKENEKEVIDISKDCQFKLKSRIKQMVNKSRKKVEFKIKRENKKGKKYTKEQQIKMFEKEAKKLVYTYNKQMYKNYVLYEDTYGWCFYTFRYINTIDTIRELDFYFCDRLRYLITGRNNRGSVVKYPTDKLKEEFGFISLVDMYKYFKDDFDVYTYKCWSVLPK